MQIYLATIKAQEVFEIELSPHEDRQLKQILKLDLKEQEREEFKDEMCRDLNRSLTSDASSTTLDRSLNSSPPLKIPKIP